MNLYLQRPHVDRWCEEAGHNNTIIYFRKFINHPQKLFRGTGDDNENYFTTNYYCTGQKRILALPVYCSNVGRECEWKGTVGTLEDHLTECQYALLPCPKQCKDSGDEISHFMRKDLTSHLKTCPNRDYVCMHCGRRGTYASITLRHDTVCPKKVLPCPNADCGRKLQRKNIKKHLESCKFTLLPCKYRRVGCSAEMQRQAMVTHETDNDTFHLQLAIDKIAVMEERQKSYMSGQLVAFRLNEFEKRKGKKDAFFSPPFYTNPGGYRLAIKVFANGYGEGCNANVAVFAFILKGGHDQDVKWPFVGTVAVTLLNQFQDKNHHTGLINFTHAGNRLPGSNWGFEKFISHADLPIDPVKGTCYLEEDSLYFRVSVKVAEHKSWLACAAE